MKIGLVNLDIFGLSRKGLHKDLNSGLGVADEGLSWPLRYFHQQFVRLPILSVLYLLEALKGQGIESKIINAKDCDPSVNTIIFPLTLIDFDYELQRLEVLRKIYPDHVKWIVYGNILRDDTYKKRVDQIALTIAGDIEQVLQHFFPTEIDFASKLTMVRYDEDVAKNTRYFPMLSWGKTYPIQASWGCPYPCRYYCPYGSYQGQQLKTRSALSVVDEIEMLASKGVRNILFRDPIFGLNKKWLEDFLTCLEEREIKKISFAIETRPDIWKMEELERLRRLGFRSINFGIDTITDETLEHTGRALNFDKAIECLEKVAKLKFYTNVFVVIGFPWEKLEELEIGIKRIIRLKVHTLRLCMATPFAGTRFDEEYGHLYEVRSGGFNNSQSLARQNELEHLVAKTNRSFFLSPRRIIAHLFNLLRLV